MKKTTHTAFTLAEIMIVLTVIGILTAIILPSARNLMPDRNLMKFKKAHNTLGAAITELVNSDKYYLNGDLGVKPNGDKVQDTDYFCQTLADILNVKSVECKKPTLEKEHYGHGFYYIYKPICMDIDGIDNGEPPFGYGVRVDGKIMLGSRAYEWLEKSISQQ